MSNRAPIFDEPEDTPDFDVSSFQPQKARAREDDFNPDTLKRLSEAHNFPSRQPPKDKKAQPARAQRRHRTGRNVQLNIKTRQETAEAFYRICDDRGWLCAETFERAIAALEKELGSPEKARAAKRAGGIRAPGRGRAAPAAGSAHSG